MFRSAVTGIFALLAGVTGGAVLTPVLLPWLPGRAFSAKGALAGGVLVAIVAATRVDPASPLALVDAVAWVLVGTAVAAFCAMNFTGASTFTSLSGVKREMRVAVPLQAIAVAVGVGLWIARLVAG